MDDQEFLDWVAEAGGTVRSGPNDRGFYEIETPGTIYLINPRYLTVNRVMFGGEDG